MTTIEEVSSRLEDIQSKAAARAVSGRLSYRGAVTPEEAWTLVEEGRARLLDVRSSAEWVLVGRVPGAVEIELKHFPSWQPNSGFLAEVRRHFAADEHIVILCRSAVRSHDAATLLTDNGYANCYNILEGFEGDKNPDAQRVVAGWKVRGLPWSH